MTALRTAPIDAISHRGKFIRRPLHAGVWVNVYMALWTEATHRIPLDRLRREVCDTQPHRKVFADVIAEFFLVDADGVVHSPDLMETYEAHARNYMQKVEAGRKGGRSTAMKRADAPFDSDPDMGPR